MSDQLLPFNLPYICDLHPRVDFSNFSREEHLIHLEIQSKGGQLVYVVERVVYFCSVP